jgi:hypothetical protein
MAATVLRIALESRDDDFARVVQMQLLPLLAGMVLATVRPR